MRRYLSIDFLRGLGIFFVVLLHQLVFHYSNIVEAIENPNIIVIIVGFLLEFGGLFVIISSIAHTVTNYGRLRENTQSLRNVLISSIVYGLFFLIMNYIYFLVFAPGLLDREVGEFRMSIIPALIRKGVFVPPDIDRYFHATILGIIGWSIIFVNIALFFMFRKNGLQKVKRNIMIMFILGTFFTVAGLSRIYLYPIFNGLIDNSNYFSAIFLGFLVNNYYPIFPYLGFAFYGSMIGLAIVHDEYKKYYWKFFFILGFFWLILGVVGYISFEDTMLERAVDMHAVSFEVLMLGIFILTFQLLFKLIDQNGANVSPKKEKTTRFFRRFGVVSFTIFMFETTFSELIGKLFNLVWGGWNTQMWSCFIFSFTNLILWTIIIFLWEKAEFKYGLEWMTGKFLYLIVKRPSTKIYLKQILYFEGEK